MGEGTGEGDGDNLRPEADTGEGDGHASGDGDGNGDGLAPGTYQGMTANPRPRQTPPSAPFSQKVPKPETDWRPWEGTPGPKYDIQSGLNSVGGKLPIKTVPRQRRDAYWANQ